MAVVASDRLTLATLPSPSYVRTYYLKQSSTLNPPSKPTANPPGGKWSTTEPTFVQNETATVYTVMLTAYGSVSFEYGPVQKSASFEAAKQAYNQAIAAGNSASEAYQKALDAKAEAIAQARTDRLANYGYAYRKTVTVYGDHDKAYPVVIFAGDQTVKRTIMVKRGYSEKSPGEWNPSQPTHRGGLNLEIYTNFGGWGGAQYSWEIKDLAQQYNQTFGGALNTASNMGFAIMLRGGGPDGAVYHLYSDQPLTGTHSTTGEEYPAIYYEGDTITNTSGTYSFKMPDPRPFPLAQTHLEDIRTRYTPKLAQEADGKADAAMTTANGKSAVTYTDVSTTPGPAPTVAMGKNRRQFDMHRNRLSNGTIVGEWMWTGTAWTRLELSDAMLSSLDVGKLTVGTANIKTGVVQKLWGQLGVFDKLDVRTDAYISGTNLKNGAVTARTLNVVPESGQGGMQLDSDGMMLIDSEGVGTVDLRVNSENYLSFYHDNATSFSVSADGELSAQNVSANESLIYRGEELSGLIDSRPKGMIARSMLKNRVISGGPWTELCSVTFTPEPGRLYRVSGSVTVRSSAYVKGHVGIKFSTRSVFSRTWALPEYTAKFEGSYTFEDIFTAEDVVSGEQEVTLSLYGQSTEDPLQIAFEGWDTSGTGKRSCYMTVEDLGAPVPWNFQTMESQKGEKVHTPVKTQKTASWKGSWQQSYYLNTNVKYPLYSGGVLVGDKRAYQGYYVASNGYLKSLIGFPSMTSTLSGATIKRVRLKLVNGYAGASAGVTAVIGLHGHSSRPNTWSHSKANIVSVHHARGSTRTVDIPSAYWAGIKSGTYKGVSLYIASTSINYYGWWDGAQAQLIIDYEK